AALIEARSIFEPLFGNANHISIPLGVVLQDFPGKREELTAHPQEATVFQDGITDLSAAFVDHYSLNVAEAVAPRVLDIRAGDLFGRDQTRSLPNIRRLLHCLDH